MLFLVVFFSFYRRILGEYQSGCVISTHDSYMGDTRFDSRAVVGDHNLSILVIPFNPLTKMLGQTLK
jgi:hypothetical protein